MGIKENFSQAMKDFINPQASSTPEGGQQEKDVTDYMKETEESMPSVPVKPQTDSAAQDAAKQAAAQEAARQEAARQAAAQEAARQAAARQAAAQEAARQAAAQEAARQAAARQAAQTSVGTPARSMPETTVISKNTLIDGNIRSFANMQIDGNIKGNVETTKNVSVNGKIVGNITCDNAKLNSSSIQGNINLKGQVLMASDSMLIGDLSSQIASLNGKIKGNLNVSGKVQLDKDSVVFGDIKASSIAISDGAIVQGYVSTTYLSNDERSNIFPESIAIGE